MTAADAGLAVVGDGDRDGASVIGGTGARAAARDVTALPHIGPSQLSAVSTGPAPYRTPDHGCGANDTIGSEKGTAD
ncbi:hypothetical protein ACFRFL_31715 [Streptomyces sp. NPDC056708]|uniref:hypothetical protein n=1 Tax=unclassified Streptomyces TaxID=2593676 RepID=UPI00368E7527